ncbi:InlB B-repeat-containing protein [Enterococcus rivorum]|uniref:InlB B-repeat-containing protein n=1 Tax=Enterococcus rivorum TaxID=762845 RepID=UPI001AE14406|nr:InlB B-repeat-containing protein [Enterococcus rivorum]MBP2100557.1 putative repeat protein (TIGR02543 family) [Enterococcus rivorum]
MTNLELVRLDDNQLTSLPESIGNLVGLEYLYLRNNNFSNLSETIGSLVSLRELYLDNNQLASLPESIGNLTELSELYLDNNQLTSLPGNIGELKNLSYLYLSSNLLPTNYEDELTKLGLSVEPPFTQRKLQLKPDVGPYTITNENDLKDIDLFSVLTLSDDSSLSLAHQMILVNYVDANNNSVDITEYIQSGKIIKSGTIFAQVRATGTGIFPNSSDNAVTTDKVQLNMEKDEVIYHKLFFDLNGGIGSAPLIQTLEAGEHATQPENPVREGHEFLGWNTVQDGSGINWSFEVDTMPTSDITLYAQWKENGSNVTPTSGDSSGNNNTSEELPDMGESKITVFEGIGSLIVLVSLLFWYKKRKIVREKK